MKILEKHPKNRCSAFSLVEVLTATVLLGILAFIAIPNIIQMQKDSEINLAIARAEAVNMSLASFIQAQGRTAAISEWGGTSNDAERYALIKPYLAFAPDSFSDYMPGGYEITLPTSIGTLSKVALEDPADNSITY